MAHRITIPAELGGGWVDIKDRRSFADSNAIAAAKAYQPRSGISREEVQAAGGDLSLLMAFDSQSAFAVPITVSVLAWSDGLIGERASFREWLDSDDCDEDVGDFLFKSIEEYYAARRRSKSATAQVEQGASGGDQSGEAPTGLRAIRDSEMGEGVPA